MTLYPGARKLLNALHDKYIRVAVCTDLLAHIQHRKMLALGLVDDVDCLVTSEEAGVEKPSPKIFAMCLKKLRLEPEEVCFVGDNYKKDIKGATAAGMCAVWFCPEGIKEPPEGEADCLKVTNYEELYELLAERIQGGL